MIPLYFIAVTFLLDKKYVGADPIRIHLGVKDGNDTCSANLTDFAEKIQESISKSLPIHSCNGTSGWRRVAYLDMTDPSQSCPPGLALKSSYSSTIRTCGRASVLGRCWSTYYETGGTEYTKVCGRVRGYQFGHTSAFAQAASGIESSYVEGVSLTHGPTGNRAHIWTFASGASDYLRGAASDVCRCVSAAAPAPPSFVGDDYFCESGHNVMPGLFPGTHHQFYGEDPLWDGFNCVTCCELPYFDKTLPEPTTDAIELRICSHEAEGRGDSPIDQVELYVQ